VGGFRLAVLVASVIGMVGCGGGTGPTPPPPPPPDPNAVATVEITAESAGMLVGDTISTTVVVKNAAGAVVTGKTVTFTSSDPNVVTAATDGRLAGKALGGPVTITAAVEGKQGTAAMTVRADRRLAYLTITNATGPWAPTTDNSYSSSGQPMTITTPAVGRFDVRLAGLASLPGQRTNIQVGLYGTTGNVANRSHCGVTGWENSGPDLVAHLNCFNTAGAAINWPFSMVVSGAETFPARSGFVRVANGAPADAGVVRGEAAWSSARQAPTVVRYGPGFYGVQFPGLDRPIPGAADMVFVTASSADNRRCHAMPYATSPMEVMVRCYSGTTPTNSGFSAMLVSQAPAGHGFGFGTPTGPVVPQANQLGNLLFSYNSSGGDVRFTQAGTGEYVISFKQLTLGGAGKHLFLPIAFSNSSAAVCSVGGSETVPELTVTIQCYDPESVKEFETRGGLSLLSQRSRDSTERHG